MRWLGIDPGNEGALALIEETDSKMDQIVALFPMPRKPIHIIKKSRVKGITVERKILRHRIDWLMVWAWLRKNVPSDGTVEVGIERLVPHPKQSNVQNIENYGRMLMLLELGRWNYREIHPASWQKSVSGMFPFTKLVVPEGADKTTVERIRRQNYQMGKDRLVKVATYLFKPARDLTSGEADAMLLARHLWEAWLDRKAGRAEQLEIGET